MNDFERVRFFVQPDGWKALAALYREPEQQALVATALTELKDAKLVAAYLLDMLCADAKTKSAQAASEAGQQTKSYEAVGEWKEEFFSPASNSEAVHAELWCARAKKLRGEGGGAGLKIQWATPQHLLRQTS